MQNLKLIKLLDLALKSDEIIELLEGFDLSVVYDFDRLNEGSEDIYWVSAYQQGFELCFDENQVLKTIFIYAAANDEHLAVDASIAGVVLYSSFEHAQHELAAMNIRTEEGQADNRWIKGYFKEYSLHFEFGGGGELLMITATANCDEESAS